MVLKKKEMVERLAAKGYTKKDAGVVIDDLFDMIVESLLDGNDVCIHGFGTFAIKEVAARESVKVNTQERIIIPAFKTLKFIPGDVLKNSIKKHCRVSELAE